MATRLSYDIPDNLQLPIVPSKVIHAVNSNMNPLE